MAREDVNPSLHELQSGSPVSQPAMLGTVNTNNVGSRSTDAYDSAAGQPGSPGFPSDSNRGPGRSKKNESGRNIARPGRG